MDIPTAPVPEAKQAYLLCRALASRAWRSCWGSSARERAVMPGHVLRRSSHGGEKVIYRIGRSMSTGGYEKRHKIITQMQVTVLQWNIAARNMLSCWI